MYFFYFYFMHLSWIFSTALSLTCAPSIQIVYLGEYLGQLCYRVTGAQASLLPCFGSYTSTRCSMDLVAAQGIWADAGTLVPHLSPCLPLARNMSCRHTIINSLPEMTFTYLCFDPILILSLCDST